MFFVLLSILFLILSSLASALIKGGLKKAAAACFGVSLSSIAGLLSFILFPQYLQDNITFSTNLSLVTFSVGIDPLTKFFLLVIFGISFVVGIYGFGYIKEQKKLVDAVPFFPLLVAAMAGVVIARDGFSFIIIWEIMSLSSFFLVTSEHEKSDVQRAGWIYLIATHLATAFLMAFFVILANVNNSFLFSDFAVSPINDPLLAGLLFIFALVGFGTKAGIFPLHIWLPHAHPAAPSYISAIMSGVMIKTGIYGILRTITFLGTPPVWWGELLIVLGVVSAVVGILYAVMQHDLKRLLAYSSIENIGIIITGIGIGLMGITKGNLLITTLGLGGAIFHILNHAIFKSILFLCAGNLAHTVHTFSIDRLGGLIKKMPVTGTVFLVAAMAICGLPPLNGFISEWLVYIGLFGAAGSFSGAPILLTVAGILGMAFAGGLAVLCFSKAFGVIFLGEARKEMPQGLHEPSYYFTAPIIILAMLCVLIGIYPKLILPIIFSAVKVVSPNQTGLEVTQITWSLNLIGVVFASLIVLTGFSLLIRKFAFRKKEVDIAVTWDCGYEHPAVTMQYTDSSFAGPIGVFFKSLFKSSGNVPKLSGVFPAPSSFISNVFDLSESNLFNPLFRKVGALLLFIRKRKKSTIQSYLTLIFVTLIVLFILEVWFGI